VELTVYSCVVAVHVMANLIAFGVWFAWPLLPGGTAATHEARARILRVVVTRAATVALVAGVYLASVAGLFGEVWVLVPLVILVALLGMTGSFLIPSEQRLADLADGGETAQYAALNVRVGRVVLAGAGLVLVAVFLMITKLGG
jgi:hypothetical protein